VIVRLPQPVSSIPPVPLASLLAVHLHVSLCVFQAGSMPKIPSTTAVVQSLARSLAPGGSIVVNTVAANAAGNTTFATLNKRLQQQQIAVTGKGAGVAVEYSHY
jgi:hypothetical protein